MLPSKFEAKPMLCVQVRHTYFSISVFVLNDYFYTYAIIDLLTNQLVFPTTVTNDNNGCTPHSLCCRLILLSLLL